MRCMRLAVAVVGLGMALNAAPAIGLSRSYLCFFDERSAAINERCEGLLREMLDIWNRYLEANQPVRFQVIGYAGDGTTPTDTLNLAMRRAVAVTRAMIRLGIAEERIDPVARRGLPYPPEPRYRPNWSIEIVLR